MPQTIQPQPTSTTACLDVSASVKKKLAFSILNSGLITNQYTAAEAIGIHPSVLDDWSRSPTSKKESSQVQERRKLTQLEENALVAQCKLGFSPQTWKVKDLAIEILHRRDYRIEIGNSWNQGFLRRNPEVDELLDAMKTNRSQEEVLEDFFTRYNELVQEYSIKPQNIYCISEFGIKLGSAASSPDGLDIIQNPRVNGYLFRGQKVGLETYDVGAILECTCGDGSALGPTIVYTKKQYPGNAWFESRCPVPGGPITLIGHAYNGWTDDLSSIDTIDRYFGLNSASHAKAAQGNEYRMLLMNKPAFICQSFARVLTGNHRVIPLCLPDIPQLQPLNTVFEGYKGELLKKWREARPADRKEKFYDFLDATRESTLSPENVRDGFLSAGLVPVDPSKCLPGAPFPVLEPRPPRERRPLEPLLLGLQRGCVGLSPTLKKELDEELGEFVVGLEQDYAERDVLMKVFQANLIMHKGYFEGKEEEKMKWLDEIKALREKQRAGGETPIQDEEGPVFGPEMYDADKGKGKTLEKGKGKKRGTRNVGVPTRSSARLKRQKVSKEDSK